MCRDLTNAFRFALTAIERVDPEGSVTKLYENIPLMSLGLARRKGRISEFEVKLGQIHNGLPGILPISLGAPSTLNYSRSDDDSPHIIEVQNEDGHKLIIQIHGHTISDSYNSLIREMAYSLAENRGFVPGYELQDWFRAERLIKKTVISA
jgi:hypothetical protein